jgi:hypothetical protein
MKANLKLVISLVCLILILSAVFVFAGNISTDSAPEPTSYTLTDIYDLINSNETANAGGHSLSPVSLPTATSSYSVSQIYADLANLIEIDKVATGTEYLGVIGDYGNTNHATNSVGVIPSSLTPTVPLGDRIGYSLEDICDLIADAGTASAGDHDDAPALPPDGSMCTLSNIYTSLVDLGVAKAPYVSPDVTYLGVVGRYYPGTGFAGGNGTEGDPYQITNWTQLNKVRDDLTAYYVLNNNLSSSDSDYISEWVPIGDEENPFSGSFDGDNKKISGLSFNALKPYNGMFGYLSGNVSNLGLIDGESISAFRRCLVSCAVGGLAGYSSGVIRNSYFVGTLSFQATNVGGLVGVSTGEIYDSYSDGFYDNDGNVGGLVSYQEGGIISRSYSTANAGSSSDYVGGLVAYSGGSIYDSYFSGIVTAGGEAVGGLVGSFDGGEISNCYSVGVVNDTNEVVVGGLVGESIGGGVANSYWDIQTSGQTESAEGMGTTTVAMQTQSTYAGWDFSDIWEISAENYPTLR